MHTILEMELPPRFHVTQWNRGLGLGGWEPSRVRHLGIYLCTFTTRMKELFRKETTFEKCPSMANDAEADFHCVIVIAVSSKHSSDHKYSFIFSLPLLFIFIFLLFYFLYFKIYCSFAIDFSICNYDNILFLLFYIREPILYKPYGFSWVS